MIQACVKIDYFTAKSVTCPTKRYQSLSYNLTFVCHRLDGWRTRKAGQRLVAGSSLASVDGIRAKSDDVRFGSKADI